MSCSMRRSCRSPTASAGRSPPELDPHGASRHAGGPAHAAAGEAGLSGVPRAHLAGKGRRQGDPHRRRGRMKLKIAAKVDNADKEYYDSTDQAADPRQPLGRVHRRDQRRQKPAFLSGAHALLFPIDWPEPFGLVMIESMACGTPVIAFNRGSVPEVIDDGVSGFIVHDERPRSPRSTGWANWTAPRCGHVRSPLHRAPHGRGLSRPLQGAVRAAGAEAARRRGLTPPDRRR